MLQVVVWAFLLFSTLSPAVAGKPSMRARRILGPDTESASAEPLEVKPLRNLGLDEEGVLSMLQLTSEESARFQSEMHTGVSLFKVNINMDIEAMDTAAGITMAFDKQNQRLRLDSGLDGAEGMARVITLTQLKPMDGPNSGCTRPLHKMFKTM
jgi:hypothetical protein